MDPEELQNQPLDDKYERYSQQEDWEDYKVDGYHPVYIGENYKEGKYKIIQKLGWGHFSTVWLAKEMSTGKYFALKIQKSKKSYSEAAQDEIQLLTDLQDKESSEIWKKMIDLYNSEEFLKGITVTNMKRVITLQDTYSIRLHDNFTHFGMHGKHFCSVFNVMGPSLLDVIENFETKDRYIEYSLVKEITKQILIALIYLHDVCNMIHTDIKPENIMISLDEECALQFREQLEKYEKLPMSMKFLSKITQSNSQKNKKKYDKKKKKRAAQKNAQQQGEEDDQDEEEKNLTEASQVKQGTSLQNLQELKSQQSNITLTSTTAIQGDSQNIETIPNITSLTNIEQQEQNDNDDDWEDCTRHEDVYNLIWKNDIIVPLNNQIQVKMVDFGNACWANKHFTERIQTREYRSPEAILHAEYYPNTDMWSLGCMIFEILTSQFLFKPHKGEGYKKSDEHLNMMQEVLGKIPKNIALSGKRGREFFNKNGQLIRIKEMHRTSIKQILVREHRFKEKDAQEIQDFLLPMLEYDPKKRISAKEALRSSWLWK